MGQSRAVRELIGEGRVTGANPPIQGEPAAIGAADGEPPGEVVPAQALKLTARTTVDVAHPRRRRPTRDRACLCTTTGRIADPMAARSGGGASIGTGRRWVGIQVMEVSGP